MWGNLLKSGGDGISGKRLIEAIAKMSFVPIRQRRINLFVGAAILNQNPIFERASVGHFLS
jgi:hypothetical protein